MPTPGSRLTRLFVETSDLRMGRTSTSRAGLRNSPKHQSPARMASPPEHAEHPRGRARGERQRDQPCRQQDRTWHAYRPRPPRRLRRRFADVEHKPLPELGYGPAHAQRVIGIMAAVGELEAGQADGPNAAVAGSSPLAAHVGVHDRTGLRHCLAGGDQSRRAQGQHGDDEQEGEGVGVPRGRRQPWYRA
jgi:hypothetical protein